MKKTPKIGNLLIAAQIITEPQLQIILDTQKDHPDLTVGEIAAQLFNIPEATIETIFADQILAPAIKGWFHDEIVKKLTAPNVEKLISDISVVIHSFTRNVSAIKHYKRQGKSFDSISEKSFLAKIDCHINSVVIETIPGEEIRFENLEAEYFVQSQRVNLENASLAVEAKIRLVQLGKRHKLL